MKFERYMLDEANKISLKTIIKTKEYNDESLSDKDKKIFEEIYPRLRKDCDYFFRQIKHKNIFLYRNMTVPSNIGIRAVRKNRIPRDTMENVHKLFDDILEDLYGFRGRSQALFCSGDANWGSSYGSSYIILPKGKFKFLWSRKYNDSYRKVGYSGLGRTILDKYGDELLEIWEKRYGDDVGDGHWSWGELTSIEKKPKAIEQMFKLRYRDTVDRWEEKRIKKEMEKEMIWHPTIPFEQYRSNFSILIHNEDLTKEEEQLVSKALEKNVIDELDYTDKDLVAAINSRNEIMLNCDEYYYFNENLFGSLLRMGLFGEI